MRPVAAQVPACGRNVSGPPRRDGTTCVRIDRILIVETKCDVVLLRSDYIEPEYDVVLVVGSITCSFIVSGLDQDRRRCGPEIEHVIWPARKKRLAGCWIDRRCITGTASRRRCSYRNSPRATRRRSKVQLSRYRRAGNLRVDPSRAENVRCPDRKRSVPYNRIDQV